MAKIVLTIQLQQDNGTPILTGTEEKTSFAPNAGAIQGDYDLVRSFIVGQAVGNLVKLMAWVAAGQVTITGTPTLTIHNLGN
jgi:hypothetical protein